MFNVLQEKERYIIQAEEVDLAYENAMSKEFAKSLEVINCVFECMNMRCRLIFAFLLLSDIVCHDAYCAISIVA